MITRTLLTALTALVCIAIPLSAQPGSMGRMNQPMGNPMMDELKFTDQQRKDVDKIHSETMKDQIDRSAQIAKAGVELRDLLKADNPNQSAIEKKLSDIGTLQTQARSSRLAAWFAINKLLTLDQQKVWKKTLESHASDGGGMMNRRMGGMGRMMRRGGPRGDMGTPQPQGEMMRR